MFVRLFLFPVGMLLSLASHADYSGHPEAQTFIQRMESEHGFATHAIEEVLGDARRRESILEAIARPAEQTLSWAEYREIFLDAERIDNGARFWEEHAAQLDTASERFGVDPAVVVAILGVETRYGKDAGSYPVLDALATLGFDYPPRADFFREELEHFLLLSREQERDPAALTGSYAGAMGYGQFMPSSYRAYAVDLDGDQHADIWESPADAIGSVANYLAEHGWTEGTVTATRLRVGADYDPELLTDGLEREHSMETLQAGGMTPLEEVPGDQVAMAFKLDGPRGAEFWAGMKNFEVITRYNRSQLYAMAVYQLANAIRLARDEGSD